MSRRARLPGATGAVTIAGLVVAVLWLATTFTWPFGWDQGIFAWVGSVILEGGMPYRDAADVKGPLAHLVYATAQAIFGGGTWGIRVVDGALMIAGALALRSIVHRYLQPPTGTWAACALLLWIGALGFWSSAQPDAWTGLLVTGAIAVLFSRDDASAAGVVAASLLVGTTALVKPFYAAYALLPLLWIHTDPKAVPCGRRITLLVLAVLGAVMPALVVAAWLAANGALADAIDVHLRFVASSYSGIDDLALVSRVRGLLDFAKDVPVLLFALPAVAVGGRAAWQVDSRRTLLIGVWAVVSLAFVVLQNRFYLYHATILFPPLAILTALGFQAVSAPEPRRPTDGSAGPSVGASLRLYGVAHLVLVVLLLLQQPFLDIRRAARYVAGAIDAQVYYRHFAPMLSYNAADQRAMVRTLRERSTPEDRVVVLGYNAGLLYLAERASVSRFGASLPWMMDTGAPIAERFTGELLGAIERTRPRWIVVGAFDGGPRSLEARLRAHGEIGRFVEERDGPAERIGHYVLLELCR